jgi:hypothetical protein
MTGRIAFAALVALSGVSLCSAASAPIGIAMSDDPILLNGAKIPGNATIFDGSALETRTAESRVELTGGARVRFGPDSRGRLFRDYVDLDKGSARLWNFSANADGLTVRAEGSAAVSLQDKVVEVAAIDGNVRVFRQGFNIANLLPGRALNLRSQDAGTSPFSAMTGCVTKMDGGFRLKDEVTGTAVQIRGGEVRAGHTFRITGRLVPDPPGPLPVLRVADTTELAIACGGAAAVGGSTTVVVPGGGETPVAVIVTGGSASRMRPGSQPEPDCMMRRGRPCRSPSPTGSTGQTGQLSGGK